MNIFTFKKYLVYPAYPVIFSKAEAHVVKAYKCSFRITVLFRFALNFEELYDKLNSKLPQFKAGTMDKDTSPKRFDVCTM